MREVFWWIVGGGLLMSAIAMVGGVTVVLQERTVRRLILPLVALAAGSLLGGAMFHMIPAAVAESGNRLGVYLWVIGGFTVFFCLEQFLQWHHCHRTISEHRPLGYLILAADGVHNFIGGLAVAGSFLIDIRVGVTTWLAAAAHEVPQELGDFGILIHSGWSTRWALTYNFLSALTFLLGSLVAYFASYRLDVTFLVPFAAGNFVYIAAADLVPEINKHPDLKTNLVHFGSFSAGLLLLLAIRLFFGP